MLLNKVQKQQQQQLKLWFKHQQNLAILAVLDKEELQKIDAYWRACNYLAVGMIYLRDNPLLKEPLKPEHIKHRLLGHWGSSPGLSFVYIHLNRLIKKYDLNMIYLPDLDMVHLEYWDQYI